MSPNPNDTWTIVSHRKNRKNQPKRAPYPQTLTLTLAPQTPTPWSPSHSQYDPHKIHQKIQSSLQRLRSSKFHHQFLSQLRSPQLQSPLAAALGPRFHLVVYGIGSVESFETPRLQISLAVLLLRELGDRILSVQVFDPVLSSAECDTMEELGFSVMRADERGRREVKVATLFFMPHCELQLYDSLLEANWGSEGLKKMAILGNSFGGYGRAAEERSGNGSVRFDSEGRRVLQAKRFVREVEMDGVGKDEKEEEENAVGFYRAFHDLSWHFFELDDDCDMNII
ncbi:protein SENSITIVITY TO RED LIGHT REDUCED 1 [Iris pallida]|uniref:Protein SENSITIVITY TO RED LIGHT REDUCED 1 n=1 Tax=Iris pallida TaxID=29817 RepID=A0AAX6E5A5_IRIPA|nr:protein SENSITIVITY TO RED LIGHT REDUCED 1 [Iris pallida]